jgi:penicillin amidase
MGKAKNRIAPGVISALFRPFFRRLAKPAQPRYRGQLTLPGLAKEVSVHWQREGIPHVYAADEHDLFFAQGYLHAQERLWQMDVNRRFLSGRLAEILGLFSVPWRELTSQFRGCDSVDADYFMRLLGIRRSALASVGILAEDNRQRLEAYSEGVNRFIEQCRRRLPLEFRLLRYKPDPWRPEDALMIGKGFAFLLSLALFTRLNAIALSAKLAGEPERLRDLYPSVTDNDSTITRALWDSMENLWRFSAGMLTAGNWCPAGQGSNAWVIGPGRSSDHRAILCNDPHMRMTLPSVWYLMHLKAAATAAQCEGYEVWGASVPGCPGIQVGHNRWIAWGVTAALCDDVEIYREKIHPVDPDRYQIDGQWHLMQRQSETIRVRRGGWVEKTVRRTRHGPVISDFNGRAPTPEVLSLRWTVHEASEDFRAVYGVNCAHNWDEFLEALSHQCAPTLNFVYADQLGNIGYSLAGKVPLRNGAPSVLPQEGWLGENEWRGYIDFRDLPRLYNPPEEAIANANNPIVDDGYPHYLSRFFEPPFRVLRIHELLAAKKTHTIKDMSAAQGDLVSLHAKGLVAILSGALNEIRAEGSDLMAAADRLLRWDGYCGAESVEAAIFHVFYHHLIKNLLIPTLGEDLFANYVEIFNQSIMPIEQILTDQASPWFERRSLDELVRLSLAETHGELINSLGPDQAQWQWGKLHTLTLNHAFGRVDSLRALFSAESFPSGGDNFTVNLGFYRLSNPYQHVVGPSLRMIAEMGHEIRSRFVLPSGQSGNAFAKHYRDQTAQWQRLEYIEISHTEELSRQWPLLSLKPPNKPSREPLRS